MTLSGEEVYMFHFNVPIIVGFFGEDCEHCSFLSSFLFELNHVPLSDILYTEDEMSVIFICDLMHTTIALTQA